MPYLGNGLSKFTTADDLTVSGDADIDGTTNLDVVDIDGAVDMASTLTVTGNVLVGTTTEGISDYGDTLTIADTDHAGMTIRSGTSSEGNVYFSDGTSGDAEYKGIVKYDHSSNAMSFWSNSLRRATIDSSGNLLVGTTTNDIYDSSSEVGSQISDGYLAVARASTVAYFNRLTSDGEIVSFRKGGSSVGNINTASSLLAIESAGDSTGLLFGTDNIFPRRNLALSDNTNELGSASYRFKNGYFNSYVYANLFAGIGDTDTLIEFPGSNVIKFVINGAERMRIANSTNVGINESSPDRQLHVNGGQANVVAKFESTDGTAAIEFTDSGGSAEIGTVNGAVVFFPGGAQKGLISSDGTLLLNQSNIAGIATATDSNSHEIGPGYMVLNRDDTATVTQIAFGKNGSIVGGISTDSNSTSLVTSSDRRLKSNIQDAASASDKIDALQVRQFDWNVDGSHQDYGLVAQELQPIEPMAVFGSEDGDEMMGVDYSKLVPMLIKEIQELRSRVATLEAS